MREQMQRVVCDWCGLEARFPAREQMPGWGMVQTMPLGGGDLVTHDLCPAHAQAVTALIAGRRPLPEA